MKKKGLFVTGILSIVVIIAVFYYVSEHENAMNHKEEMVSGKSITEGNTLEEKEVKQSEQSEQKNNKKNESSENGSSEMRQESEGEVIVGEPNPAIYGTESNKIKSPNKKDDENSYISFPYVSDSGQLIIQDIYNYSGYYIEDGTESEVENIAVIEVKNTAQSAMEYGEIHLKTGGDTLSFHVSLLPAGETAIVMEADKKTYDPEGSYTYEGSKTAYLSKLDKMEDKIKIENDSTGTVKIVNISEKTLPEVRIFYKNQLESGEFIGGIAYTAKINDLKAGESKSVQPSHFDPECGVIMMVRIYE